MIKKTLNAVKNKTIKVSLLDLLKFKHYTTGCIEKDGKIYSYGFLEDKKVIKLPNDFIDFLVIDGEIIFYSNDGKLYKQNGNDFELYTLEKFKSKPIVLEFFKQGVKTVMLVENGFAVIKGKNIGSTILPVGDDVVLFNNRVFVSDKRSVKICGILDHLSTSTKNDQLGFINLEFKYGEILKLVPLKERLIIICENKILSLTSGDSWEDFTLNEVCDLHLSIAKNSILGLNEKVYFSNGEELFVFFNDKIEKLVTFRENITFIKPAFSVENTYSCEITKGDKKGLVLYDTKLNKHTFNYFSYSMSYNQYFYNQENSVIAFFTLKKTNETIKVERKFEILDVHFNQEEKAKTLFYLNTNSTQKLTTIFYDKANLITLEILPTESERAFNFLSKNFSVKVLFNGCAEIENFAIKYRV